jgi:hypothetical protein
MTDGRSWRPIYNAMCPEPGARDLFLVVLINGRRVAIQHATEYERWRDAAQKLAHEQQCQVKVLPMAGEELMGFLNIQPSAPQPLEAMDPAFREQAITNCMDVLRECGKQEDREQALSLLGHLGVLQ